MTSSAHPAVNESPLQRVLAELPALAAEIELERRDPPARLRRARRELAAIRADGDRRGEAVVAPILAADLVRAGLYVSPDAALSALRA